MAIITASMVKELRERTGLGMMDCKKALGEADGDMEKAIEDLRKASGLKAAKKASRVAAEGVVKTKIAEDGNFGVVIEVNSETDFVARGELFQGLLRDVAMQIAACPNVEYVTVDDIPKDIIENEKSIEMGRDDLDGKPEQIKSKIVEGRIAKRLKELALVEQPFIRDSALSVQQLVKQVAGQIGENVQVRRFTRYTLGEGIEVGEADFAAEVASMSS